jgi:hypothetical protein
MIKRFLLAVVLMACSTSVYALGKVNIVAELGGQSVSVAGFSSTTKVMKTYPGATVAVYVTGTSTLATIYSSAGLASKTNPFTASTTDASAPFWVADGDYDVTFTCTAPNCTTEAGKTWTISGIRVLASATSLQDLANVKNYAATDAQRLVVGDGNAKPLSGYYATLAEAQAAYSHVTALTEELDWAVIQEAVNTLGDASRNPTYGGAAATVQGLYFPTGIFVINEQVTMNLTVLDGATFRIWSDSNAIIRQTNSAKDILVWSNAYDVEISGIVFAEGDNHIRAVNAGTTDQSRMRITHCDFRLSSGYSIYIESTGESVYDTLLTIDGNTRFDTNEQMLYSNAAPAYIRDIWYTGSSDGVTVASASDLAMITNKGVMHIENFWGSPVLSSLLNQRWIDNYGSLYIDHSRFGGEGPTSGVPIVWNFAGPQTTAAGGNGFVGPTVISIQNSALASGTDTTSFNVGNIVLQDDMAQVIIMKGNEHYTHAPKIVVGNQPGFVPATYFATFPADYRWKMELEPVVKWQDEINTVVAVPIEILRNRKVVHNMTFTTAVYDVTLANGLNSNINIGQSARFIRASGPTGAYSIGGFLPVWPGREIRVILPQSQTATIVVDDASTTLAANRIWPILGSGNLTLCTTNFGYVDFVYDGPLARWVVSGYHPVVCSPQLTVAHASLGSATNGVFKYCSDCTKGSTPCTAGSTGAMAKRENGAWNCD